jgi:glycosyltransferase involved in cell wall biosynthesis
VSKSEIHYPGIDCINTRDRSRSGNCRILWTARWEHDQNPEDFFAAINCLVEKNLSFRLSVIGQHFQEQPKVFDQAYHQFVDYIDHWGYQEDHQAYQARLLEADIVVSTALHEFFGIGIVEAIAAGAYPLLPRRLSYPELLQLDQPRPRSVFSITELHRT